MIAKNKRGDLTVKEIMELILAAAGIFILIVLMINFFLGGYDQNREQAKNYFSLFKNIISQSEGGKVAEFNMWDPGNGPFYLVYFGDKNRISGQPQSWNDFITTLSGDNKICICYSSSGKSVCKDCINLNSPADTDYRVYSVNMPVSIRKLDGKYQFRTNSFYFKFLDVLKARVTMAEKEASLEDQIKKSFDPYIDAKVMGQNNQVWPDGLGVNDPSRGKAVADFYVTPNGKAAQTFNQALAVELKRVFDIQCPRGDYRLSIPQGTVIKSLGPRFVSTNSLSEEDQKIAQPVTSNWKNVWYSFDYKGNVFAISYWYSGEC